MSSGTFVDRIDPFAKRSLKKKSKKSQGSSRYRTATDVELQQLPLLKGSLVNILDFALKVTFFEVISILRPPLPRDEETKSELVAEKGHLYVPGVRFCDKICFSRYPRGPQRQLTRKLMSGQAHRSLARTETQLDDFEPKIAYFRYPWSAWSDN